jgi:glutamyl-tRNA synthetase
MACVSDDVTHGITHVLRGDDHISNTPKQILIYQALQQVGVDAPMPQFGHLPMILGPDGHRLSKRHGATSVQQYRDEGILPEAMTNFLALLGWNPGDDREILSFDELVEAFSTERILKKASIFDTTKLEWMSGEYFRRLPRGLVVDRLLRERPVDEAGRGWYEVAVDQFMPRSTSINQLEEKLRPFHPDWEPVYDPATVAKRWTDPEETIDLLRFVSEEIVLITEHYKWDPQIIEDHLRKLAELRGIGFGKLVHPLRLALTGSPDGCGIDWTVYLLGPELFRARIERAISFLGKEIVDGVL